MKPKPFPYRFALLRHAQTHWNVAKRIQGQKDSSLTENGRKQALVFAKKIQSLDFSAILCSDLGRALQTAKIINFNLNLPLIKENRLREQDWGGWSGKTLASVRKEDEEYLTRQVAAGWDFCPPQGENRREVFQRGCAALKSWSLTSKYNRTLVITHEGVIKCLIYGLSGRKFLPHEPSLIKSNHLHWVTCNGSNLAIEKINAQNMGQDAAP
jgi:broad specificity phosphatase PhoE